MLELTETNYYSQEANEQYMSVSLYKQFLKCPAQAMAQLKNEWKPEDNINLLVGSYVHSHFDSSMDTFKMEHPQIFNKDGSLKAQYRTANDMIGVIDEDSFCQYILEGESEKIFTAEIFGTMWKMKADRFNLDRQRFADLKTTRNFEKVYDPIKKCRVSFAEFWKYDIQIAMYREIIAKSLGWDNRPEGFIVAVTKENVPDKSILSFDLDSLNKALEEVQTNLPGIMDIKEGRTPAWGCNHCDFCKATKKLDRIVNYKEI